MRILWDNDPASVERYQYAVGGDLQRVDSTSMLERSLHDHPQASLILIGPEIGLDEACALAERFRIDRAEVSIVLLRARLDVGAMGQALRSGIREVVQAGDHQALSDAVSRCDALWQKLTGQSVSSGSRHGKLVTVFSPKGGVGKTTIATNLGVHLARKGLRTLVVDLDLAFGDVAISLQIVPERTFSDVLSMSGQLDAQALSQISTMHVASGVDVICAPADPADADRIPAAMIQNVLRAAVESYDFVIVDTPPAFTEQVLTACDMSDVLVLVTALDIPAVKNLRIALDTFDMLGNPPETRVVVLNRADARVGLRPEDVEAAIKHRIGITIPNSSGVQAAVNRGVPVVMDDARSPVSAAVRELADVHIQGRFSSARRAETRRGRRRGLLRGAR